MPSSETPEHGLTKSVWTEADFETMGWHDAILYCFTVLNDSIELVMDLDYITRWVLRPPEPDPYAGRERRPPWLQTETPLQYFDLWIAPATLVFRGVQNISAALEIRNIDDVEILALKRSPLPDKPSGWRWRFELANGHLSFDADGYTQYFRREPLLRSCGKLTLEERGDISYARVAYDGSA